MTGIPMTTTARSTRGTPATGACAAFVLLVAAGAALLAGCDSDLSSPQFIGGRYAYTAWNSGDTAVVTGTIYLANPDSTALVGSWELRTVRGATDTGPQVGFGSLAGSTAGGVTINLNPGWVDNNVYLSGSFDGNSIEGDWQWVTLTGVTASGRFEMKKP